MPVTLEADAVRLSAAKLMAYRLRVGGFAAGRGGARVADFTAETVPTLADATDITTRNAGLVSDDFPTAIDGDEPELRTIAALRSAIELEASAPNMDFERIRVWREQLREYVTRVGGSGGDSASPPGSGALAAMWGFGSATCWPEGAERPCDPCPPVYQPGSRRLRW